MSSDPAIERLSLEVSAAQLRQAQADTPLRPIQLEQAIKEMYTEVAENPDGDFHFLTGRPLAEALGYDPALLDRIPAEVVDSFPGVGHYFDLADLAQGETVVDLGSGSGTDLFCAAVRVGARGRAIGIDMTSALLAKAARLRDTYGPANVELIESRIESVPLPDGVPTGWSPTARSPRPGQGGGVPRRPASCGRAAGWRWPTS